MSAWLPVITNLFSIIGIQGKRDSQHKYYHWESTYKWDHAHKLMKHISHDASESLFAFQKETKSMIGVQVCFSYEGLFSRNAVL